MNRSELIDALKDVVSLTEHRPGTMVTRSKQSEDGLCVMIYPCGNRINLSLYLKDIKNDSEI